MCVMCVYFLHFFPILFFYTLHVLTVEIVFISRVHTQTHSGHQRTGRAQATMWEINDVIDCIFTPLYKVDEQPTDRHGTL